MHACIGDAPWSIGAILWWAEGLWVIRRSLACGGLVLPHLVDSPIPREFYILTTAERVKQQTTRDNTTANK